MAGKMTDEEIWEAEEHDEASVAASTVEVVQQRVLHYDSMATRNVINDLCFFEGGTVRAEEAVNFKVMAGEVTASKGAGVIGTHASTYHTHGSNHVDSSADFPFSQRLVRCIQSPGYPTNYGNNENCNIAVLSAGTLQVTAFNTESGFDFFYVGSARYDGTSGPNNVAVTAGTTLRFTTDGSVTRSGWYICLSMPSPPPPSSPPASPSPRPPYPRFCATSALSSSPTLAHCLLPVPL
ncbi:hypothetical protein CYMTET_11117 [Cymbomonas tetramitiformis]|uniref:CUB domain-containing protein n=1 Tax=Cymbomonas tetramitiformis TaxID=36881 RepID=A0AAE0GPB3_9CHLO|nr:hypothetical protein CYMTET_11117 [Cymbomonas tetramitiformis]